MQEDPQRAGPLWGGRGALRIAELGLLDACQPVLMVSSCGSCKALSHVTSLRLPTAHHHVPISQKMTRTRTMPVMAICGAPVQSERQAESRPLILSSDTSLRRTLLNQAHSRPVPWASGAPSCTAPGPLLVSLLCRGQDGPREAPGLLQAQRVSAAAGGGRRTQVSAPQGSPPSFQPQGLPRGTSVGGRGCQLNAPGTWGWMDPESAQGMAYGSKCTFCLQQAGPHDPGRQQLRAGKLELGVPSDPRYSWGLRPHPGPS